MDLLGLIKKELSMGPLSTLEERLFISIAQKLDVEFKKTLEGLYRNNKMDFMSYTQASLALVELQKNILIGDKITSEEC